MAVRALWVVDINIPQIVFDAYFMKNNCPYAFEYNEAIKGYVTAEELYYGDPYTYITFHTQKEAEECERKLKCVMAKYEKILTSSKGE